MVKNKVKNQWDSWDDATKKLAKWQVEFIEQNKEKLTLGTQKGVRGVQVVFLRNRHEILADAKRDGENIYFEDSIEKESATPCIFSPIESLRKENFPPDAYKAIENYDPDIEIAVMFFISPGSEQLYVIKRTDVD